MQPFPEKVSFPEEEERILAYWKEKNCFLTSVEQSRGKKPYTFYDGPPFATGTPHYGHILAGTIKDCVCRFAHQTGHHVERRFGWDCHGLPIEFEIEKSLGIKNKQEILELGIPKYNAACRGIVLRYVNEWETTVTRCGRWIDFKNDYKTMNLSYMESVWWVFSELWKKGLVYRGTKVMPYSTGCTTPLSNFEANMNYQEVHDPSVIITFPMVADPNVQFVAWTTTPWTLPSNVAICLHPEMKYVKVKDNKTGKFYIFAEFAKSQVYPKWEEETAAGKPPFEVVETAPGSKFEGTQYVPLFEYFGSWRENGGFRVLLDTYVKEGDGTGIVHTAPGFGADDYRIAVKAGIVKKGVQPPCPIDDNGNFTAEVPEYEGKYIKQCDDDICATIKKNGRLISKQSKVHSYPFCWRSKKPLIYKCVASWFVNVEELKPRMIKNCEATYWVPDHVKSKRFNNWLEDAVDWCVSRSRYWGTPLPIWRSDDWEEIVCVGSVAELEELTGVKGINDLHRESIDHLTIPSKQGKGVLRRVEDVFDCWFESGSMPYAQSHYPFENKEKFENGFPADFIAEGIDQTRGWFYTLLVLGTALFDTAPFKNLICNGLILTKDGQKMSKSMKNYTAPEVLINQHTADAMRLYVLNSPAVRAENLKFVDQGVKDVVRDVIIPLWNTCKLFQQLHSKHLQDGNPIKLTTDTSNVMDRWIKSSAAALVKTVRAEMGAYRLYNVLPAITSFIVDLSNWYVRMNKRRMKGLNGIEEASQSLSTLFSVLYTSVIVIAPFTPFIAENLYQRMRPVLPEESQAESVHYLMIPEVKDEDFDNEAMRKVTRMQKVIELVRTIRDNSGKTSGKISTKMPVKEVLVIHPSEEYRQDVLSVQDYIKEETNTLEVNAKPSATDYVAFSAQANMQYIGKKYGKEGKAVADAVKKLSEADILQFIAANQVELLGKVLTEEDIKVIRTAKPQAANYELDNVGDLVVLVNKDADENMFVLHATREFVNRVQQLRKKLGLTPVDSVVVYYGIKDKFEHLENGLSSEAGLEQVRETLNAKVLPLSQLPADAVLIGNAEEVEIRENAITLQLTKA